MRGCRYYDEWGCILLVFVGVNPRIPIDEQYKKATY